MLWTRDDYGSNTELVSCTSNMYMYVHSTCTCMYMYMYLYVHTCMYAMLPTINLHIHTFASCVRNSSSSLSPKPRLSESSRERNGTAHSMNEDTKSGPERYIG